MRLQLIRQLAAFAAGALLLASCGGGGRGGSALPGLPQGSGGTGASPSSVVVSGAINGSGPQILARKRRLPAALRRTKALSFHNITVSATIYPSYAGSVPISPASCNA